MSDYRDLMPLQSAMSGDSGAMQHGNKFPICELLRVEVGQHFHIDYPKGPTAWMYVDNEGLIRRVDGKDMKLGNAFPYAVNHPESIIRASAISVEDAKTLAVLLESFPTDTLKRVVKSADGKVSLIVKSAGSPIELKEGLFQSLPVGVHKLRKLRKSIQMALEGGAAE